jgi:hypothetical protein
MIVIAFEKNIKFGGFGDRVVGLIACKVIAELLGQDFYIMWNKEDIKEYINYEKYDFELLEDKNTDVKLYRYIDNQRGLKQYLVNETTLFPNKINKFYLNQEISQYLYKNKLFTHQNYYDDIFKNYQKLYTDILKPTDKLLMKINSYTEGKNNIIGIQIRAGDNHMITNKGERHNIFRNPQVDIRNILLSIKSHCDSNNNNYYVFITSDYHDIYNISSNIWNKDKIIYCDDIIQHIDRKAVQSDISKIFIDSYILSQKTNSLYISVHSNFGRIAALSCKHSNIFNINTLRLNKKYLLSKHENIFA